MLVAMRSGVSGAAIIAAIVSQNFLTMASGYTTYTPSAANSNVSRAGQAMVYDSTGKLTYAPNNLALYSQDISNAYWAAAYNSGVTRTTNTLTFTSSTGYLYSSINGLVPGVKYIYSAVISNGTKGGTLLFGPLGGNTVVTLTGTPTRYFGTVVASGTSLNLGFENRVAQGGDGLTGSVNITDIQLEAVTYETSPRAFNATTASAYYGPRFDYNPATLASKGLLVEGARTNLAVYSSAIASNWTAMSVALAVSGVSPDGTANAVTVTPDATTNPHKIFAGATPQFTVAATGAFSFYVKPNGYTQVAIREDAATGSAAVFTLTGAGVVNGTHSAGAVTTSNPRIEQLPNGWYRISAVFTSTGGNMRTALVVLNGTWSSGDPTTIAWAGNGTSGVFVYGPQVEAGAFPTSYIPTAAASVTRAAETYTPTAYTAFPVDLIYTDEQTGATGYSVNLAPAGTWAGSGWVTSIRALDATPSPAPSWLDYSGITGNRMMYDATGTLTYAPNNLLLQSNTFSHASWTKSNGAITSGVADPFGGTNAFTWTASGAVADVAQQISMASGQNMIVSVWVRRRTGSGTVSLRTPASSDAAIAVTGTWTQFSWVGVNVANPSFVLRLATSGDAVDIYAATYSLVTYETRPRALDQVITTTAAYFGPRFDYDPATLAARGLLIEESRTNLALYSQTPSDVSWSEAGVVKTSTNNSDPFGTNIALLVTASGGSTHILNPSNGLTSYTSGTTYTLSAFVKAGTTSLVQLTGSSAAFGASQYANFQLTGSGTVTASAGGVARIQNIGNGWYRISFTVTATATAAGSSGAIIFISSGTDGRAPAFVSTDTLYVIGAQAEVGAFPTSYIPTTTASVTRAADVIKLSGSALTAVQGAAFSTVLEHLPISWQTNTVMLGAGASVALLSISSNTQGSTYDAAATPAVVNATAGSGGFATTGRLAFGGDGSSRSLAFNDGTVGTAAGPLVAARSTVHIGSYTNQSAWASGWYRGMSIYNQRLDNATLKTKSVVGSPY